MIKDDDDLKMRLVEIILAIKLEASYLIVMSSRMLRSDITVCLFIYFYDCLIICMVDFLHSFELLHVNDNLNSLFCLFVNVCTLY